MQLCKFTTIWTNLTDVTPTNLNTKFQINWTCSFREEDFLTKNRKNCPKKAIMHISPQFEQIWLRSSLGTSIPSFKSIGLVISEKKIFWPKIEKNCPKIQLCKFHHNLDKSNKVTPSNLHTKFQINQTCHFREDDFLTKNGKNWPKKYN